LDSDVLKDLAFCVVDLLQREEDPLGWNCVSALYHSAMTIISHILNKHSTTVTRRKHSTIRKQVEKSSAT
jgi:hypothetical protein